MRHKIEVWLACWLDMLEGLVGVVTFTLWLPWWGMKFRVWMIKQNAARRKKQWNAVKRRNK